MAVRLEDYLAKLPKQRRDAIERHAQELIAEEAALQQLRKVRAQTQDALARTLDGDTPTQDAGDAPAHQRNRASASTHREGPTPIPDES